MPAGGARGVQESRFTEVLRDRAELGSHGGVLGIELLGQLVDAVGAFYQPFIGQHVGAQPLRRLHSKFVFEKRQRIASPVLLHVGANLGRRTGESVVRIFSDKGRKTGIKAIDPNQSGFHKVADQQIVEDLP